MKLCIICKKPTTVSYYRGFDSDGISSSSEGPFCKECFKNPFRVIDSWKRVSITCPYCGKSMQDPD